MIRQPATIKQLLLATTMLALCGAAGSLLFALINIEHGVFMGAGFGLLAGIPLALLTLFMSMTPAHYESGNPYLRRRAEQERKRQCNKSSY